MTYNFLNKIKLKQTVKCTDLLQQIESNMKCRSRRMRNVLIQVKPAPSAFIEAKLQTTELTIASKTKNSQHTVCHYHKNKKANKMKH